MYPLKLRVYHQGKTVFYPLIYDLTRIDFEKFKSKRISDALSKIRENLASLELDARIAATKMVSFNFEQFSTIFVLTNEYFRKRTKVQKPAQESQKIIDDIPAEWKKKFGIFKEVSSGPECISETFFSIIKSLLYQARIGTATNYQTSYNSVKAFRGNVKLSEITPRFLKEYEGWMTVEKGNSKTTVSMYTRCIRSVINEAIENNLVKREDYPFGKRRYAIPMGRNIKKALNKESISKLYYSEVEMENQQKAKDFWFFSFYGNGMNVKDIICLKYKNIKGEFLVFERAKTELTNRGGEPIIISCFLNEDMLKIIDRWGNKDKDPENYIFPVLSSGLSPIRQFEIKQNFTRFINKNMAKVSDMALIEKKVKTMESRHSASTLMKNAGVSPHYIKEALGHASLKTTENYLAGFENEKKKEFSKVLDDFKKIKK